MRKNKEYGMTQKGLDAIDRIIKESPQYKELIEEFIDDLKPYGDKVKSLREKWEEKK